MPRLVLALGGVTAVAVAAVLALNLSGGQQPVPGVGGQASPSPSPKTTPTPASSPTAVTGLPVGSSYVLISDGGVRGTVTIPAPGWFGGGGTLTRDDVDPPSGAGVIVFTGPLHVYGDPCAWSTTIPEAPATTVDELVAALAAQASRDASEPVDVTAGGYSGKSITLHVPDDAAYASGEFRDCDQGYFGSWGVPEVEPTPARYHQGPGQVDEVWALDVGGVLTVIDAAYYEGTPAELVDQMRAIVESATFE